VVSRPLLPPFLSRPHPYLTGAGGESSRIKPPRDLPYPPIMLRVSRDLGVPLHVLDEWSWDDIFDEAEASMYMSDLALEESKRRATLTK